MGQQQSDFDYALSSSQSQHNDCVVGKHNDTHVHDHACHTVPHGVHSGPSTAWGQPSSQKPKR